MIGSPMLKEQKYHVKGDCAKSRLPCLTGHNVERWGNEVTDISSVDLHSRGRSKWDIKVLAEGAWTLLLICSMSMTN
jgi:hypothetical protein